MKTARRILSVLMALALMLTSISVVSFASPAINSPSDADINYLRLHNHNGPSGVPLGGTGVGFYEISPEGTFTRNCINNIHKSFVDSPNGMFAAVWQNGKAVRLQRDNDTKFGMKGYSDSYYTGLFPRIELDFENPNTSGAGNASFNAYSGVVAQNVKDSSLPVAWYEIELTNTSNQPQQMSAMLSWADLIGRGIKDTVRYNNSNFNPDGESSDWYNMTSPDTIAEDIAIGSWKGVKQSANGMIMPNRMTFQNYNTDFVILAEEADGVSVSTLKSYSLSDSSALSSFTSSGKFTSQQGKVSLSSSKTNASSPSNGSAVAVSTTVGANETKTVKFMVAWYMPEYTDTIMAQIPSKAPHSDYNKYYHNFFSSVEEIAAYASSNGNRIYNGIMEWQTPILNSNMPDWLKFKEINSAYTLFTNGVLNKRMNFSTLEGEMGGFGGTMDQKMSSHPFYEKLFPQLNMNENLQFTNVLGSNGEIQHYDVHYYIGMADSDPDNKYNPTPNGSMIDNTGAWMIQMYNYYRQTGDDTYIKQYYDIMKNSMEFIQSKCANGTNFPNYYTTYDDYSHPDILIFSGIVYLNMLDIAQDLAIINNKPADAAYWNSLYDLTAADVQKLYVENGNTCYYAFGSDVNYIASDKASGSIKSNIMFSGAMAGEFMSRYSGLGDVIPFDQFVSHMKAFINTSIQGTGDYYAPKVYDMSSNKSLDNSGSRCWPFYLDSYGGMAAIQAGFVEDGFEVMEHTQLVNFRKGYTWSYNLWNPAYSTYMTAPVMWFVNDVLAGSSIDVPAKTLTLGPTTIPGEDKLVTPLYYPKYWAELTYDKVTGNASYKITKTFYESNESPIEYKTLNIAPNGTASSEATTHSINFTVTEGAVLDLSGYMSELNKNVVLRKNLSSVPMYDSNYVHFAKTADGEGLQATYYKGTDTTNKNIVNTETVSTVDFTWGAGQSPVANTDSYTIKYSGNILPRYSQTYELRFVVKGDMELEFNGKSISSSNFKHTTNNGSITVPEGCTLNVIQADLEADVLYPIEITYKNTNAANGGLVQFMWWSTNQIPELVPTEHLFAPLNAYEEMRAVDYAGRSGNIRQTGDVMDYAENNNWILYKSVDFGDGLQDGKVSMLIGGPDNDVCHGGTVEIHKGSANGEIISTVAVGTTSDWDDFAEYSGDISLSEPLVGKQNICIVFRPSSTFLGNLYSFSFEKSAYNPINAVDYSSKSGRIMKNGDSTCMEYVENNNWLMFKDLDFKDGFTDGTIMAEASVMASDNCTGGNVEVRIGSPTGTLLGTIRINPTTGWDDYQKFTSNISLDSKISGNHDVYFIFKSDLTFIGNIKSFKITNTTGVISAYEPISALDYTTKYGRICEKSDDSCMEYIENNNWLGFTNVDFGTAGIKKGTVYVSTAVSEDVNNNGGTAEVRIDSPTGQLIGSVSADVTGSWDNYVRFTGEIDLDDAITGIHSVYFVFKPNRMFYGNINYLGFERDASEEPAVLESIDTIPAITVGKNAEKTVEGLMLPACVNITTTKGSTSANISWNVNGCSYVVGGTQEQTFTVNGTVELPENVLNTNGVSLNITASVTVAANTKSAYELLNAVDYSEKNGRIQNSGDNSCMEYVENNNWLKFGQLDFNDGFSDGIISVKASAVKSDNCTGGTVEVRTGSPTGQLIGTIRVNTTDSWSDYREFTSKASVDNTVSGLQDIYFIFKADQTFIGNIKSFLITRADISISAYEPIPATEYTSKSGRIQNSGSNTCMEYVEDGNWLRFGKVNFGDEGIKKGSVYVSTAISEDSTSKGGTAEIRLDSPDGQLIATVTATPTNGWDDYRKFSADFNLDQPITGIHSVYFIFKANARYYGNVNEFGFIKSSTRDLTEIPEITGISVPNGASKSAEGLNLPETVAILTDGGEMQADVEWDVEDCNYIPKIFDEQTFSVNGTVILPENVENSNNISLGVSVSVTVAKAEFSLTSDSEYYKPEDIITFNAIVPEYVTKIGILNENGRYMGVISRTCSASDIDGYNNWTLSTYASTTGNRDYTLVVFTDNSEYIINESLNLIISNILPNSNEPLEIYKLRVPESALVNETFTVTIKTSVSVTNIGIYNADSGKSMGKVCQSYYNNNGQRTWTVSLKVGTKGSRNFTVKVSDINGNWSDNSKDFSIAIYR